MTTAQTGLNSPIQLRQGRQAPDGIPLNLKGFFDDVYQTINSLQISMIQFTGVSPSDPALWSQLQPTDTIMQQNMGRLYAKATEAIAYGAIVNIQDDGVSGFTVRNANATTNAKFACGFCNTQGGIANGQYGEIIIGAGLNLGIAGMTRGVPYYLSTTNGLITSTKPVAAGNIEQFLGFAYTSSILHFNSHYWIQH